MALKSTGPRLHEGVARKDRFSLQEKVLRLLSFCRELQVGISYGEQAGLIMFTLSTDVENMNVHFMNMSSLFIW
jgi:hypothetical protein